MKYQKDIMKLNMGDTDNRWIWDWICPKKKKNKTLINFENVDKRKWIENC